MFLSLFATYFLTLSLIELFTINIPSTQRELGMRRESVVYLAI